jgi:hypothetical protein
MLSVGHRAGHGGEIRGRQERHNVNQEVASMCGSTFQREIRHGRSGTCMEVSVTPRNPQTPQNATKLHLYYSYIKF